MDHPTKLGEISEKHLNWILTPISSGVLFIGDEMKIHSVVTRAIVSMRTAPVLLGVVREALKKRQIPLPSNHDGADVDRALQRLIVETPANFAEEIEASDFAVLNAHSFVALWAGLEICMENTFALILMNDATARQAVRARHPKLKLDEVGPLDEDNCRRAASQWERLERDGRTIVNAWTSMLATVDILTTPNPDTDAVITEANAVRNAIMHRGGLIDAAAIKQAPTLAGRLDQKIVISRKEYSRYTNALHQYVIGLMKAITTSRYIKTRLPDAR